MRYLDPNMHSRAVKWVLEILAKSKARYIKQSCSTEKSVVKEMGENTDVTETLLIQYDPLTLVNSGSRF